MKFTILPLNDDLMQGIADAGYLSCTPVQEQSLPESLKEKDMIVQAQTGTGKTAVFLITIFNNLHKKKAELHRSPLSPQVLIMVPTRELAIQVDQEAKKLGKHLPFRSIAIYGGVGYEKQTAALSDGVDIVVATPGRLIDLFKNKTIFFSNINHFVIDEADRLLDMGFKDDILYIANNLPYQKKTIQTMLFSATITGDVHLISKRYLRKDAELIEVEPEQITVDTIDQKIIYVSNEEKFPALMALLKKPEVTRVIIFTNMKVTAEKIGWKLKKNGFPAHYITGDLSQAKRQQVIEKIKSGEMKILVATDVAARGLHIENVSHVINYDLPEDAANYVHRIGRTARAGKSGIAYNLACEDHVFNLPAIEKFIDRSLEKEWIDEADLVEDKSGHYRKKRPSPGEEKNRFQSKGKPKHQPNPTSRTPKKNTGSLQNRSTEKQNRNRSSGKSDKPQGAAAPRSAEERLLYYEKKYGESFKRKEGNEISADSASSFSVKKEEPKKNIFKKFLNILSG